MGGEKMNTLIDELKLVLKEELESYKTMLEYGLKKTEIITSGQAKELDKLTQIEQALIMKIGKLEDKREEIVEKIGHELNIKEDINLSTILPYIDKKDEKEINDIRDELVDILNKLKDRNQLNGVLINDSLEYINFNIDLLTQSTSIQGTTYGKGKEKEESLQNRNLFDKKV